MLKATSVALIYHGLPVSEWGAGGAGGLGTDVGQRGVGCMAVVSPKLCVLPRTHNGRGEGEGRCAIRKSHANPQAAVDLGTSRPQLLPNYLTSPWMYACVRSPVALPSSTISPLFHPPLWYQSLPWQDCDKCVAREYILRGEGAVALDVRNWETNRKVNWRLVDSFHFWGEVGGV